MIGSSPHFGKRQLHLARGPVQGGLFLQDPADVVTGFGVSAH